VLADRLLGERELRRDLPGGQLMVLDQAEDLPAVRVGERLSTASGAEALAALSGSAMSLRSSAAQLAASA
jgi:hypothetical protein